MRNHLGIDHPLVAVGDMDKAADDFRQLGFYINPRHHHPWGTDNHLLMFPENFIELISVYDPRLLDQTNERGFAFGRFIANALARREGIAMVALHSEDARADHAMVEARGLENHGIVDFRRVAHRPDGSEEEAVVSLVMLVNRQDPALSHFFCHQHKPHLVWVEDWMQHPNGAHGITAVTYVDPQPERQRARFAAIYGEAALSEVAGGLSVRTDRGVFEVLTPERARQRFAGVELPAVEAHWPCGVAIQVQTRNVAAARRILEGNQIPYVALDNGGCRISANYAGNTILELVPEATLT